MQLKSQLVQEIKTKLKDAKAKRLYDLKHEPIANVGPAHKLAVTTL